MKIVSNLLIVLFATVLLSGCNSNGSAKKASEAEVDSLNAPDSIIRHMSGEYAVNEISYRNGKMNGLYKTFYKSGKVRTAKWYVNDLIQDSVIWFYEEGEPFRITPYKNDTIDGIQKQYYRTGQLRAKIGFSKGFRTNLFQEFTREGKLITGYPEIVVTSQDNYMKNGTYSIMIELSDKKTKVNFFRGEFRNGIYDTTMIEKIRTKDNTGYLNLKKGNAPTSNYVGVMAEVLTNFSNRILIYKKIDLPYNDLE